MSFLGSGLQRPEQIAAAWFGPKGFAAVAVGLLVLESQIPAADAVYHLVVGTIVLSVLAHSSTEVLVARWFDEPAGTPYWPRPPRRRSQTLRLESIDPPRRVVGVAMLLMAAGVASVSLPGPDAGSLMPILAVIGIGGGLTVPLTSSVLEAMPREKAAVATGIFNASREVSRLLGINVIGTVLRSAAGPAVRRSVARGRLPGWIPSRPVAGAAFGALGGAAGYFGLQRRTVGRHARACQQQGRSRSQNGQWTQRLRFWVPDFGAE